MVRVGWGRGQCDSASVGYCSTVLYTKELLRHTSPLHFTPFHPHQTLCLFSSEVCRSFTPLKCEVPVCQKRSEDSVDKLVDKVNNFCAHQANLHRLSGCKTHLIVTF